MYNIYNEIKLQSIIIVFLIIFCPHKIYAQKDDLNNAYQLVTSHYGVNPVLVNGRYFENKYTNDIGHPFLLSDNFLEGKLVIHNQSFNNIYLKYNIWSQELVVMHNINSYDIFIPPTDYITQFSIANKCFKKYSFENYKPAFYEVVYNGKISCLYAWSKYRKRSDQTDVWSYSFSEANRKSFLVINNVIYSYKGKTSFLKLFPKQNRKAISEYLKQQKVNIRYAPNTEITKIIKYCEHLNVCFAADK